MNWEPPLEPPDTSVEDELTEVLEDMECDALAREYLKHFDGFTNELRDQLIDDIVRKITGR